MTRPIISDEELYLLRESILLPLLIEMIETGLTNMDESKNILKRAYLMTGSYMVVLVKADLARIRRQLSTAKIVSWEKGSTKHVLVHRYVRYNEESFLTIDRKEARAELSIRLGHYTEALKNLLGA